MDFAERPGMIEFCFEHRRAWARAGENLAANLFGAGVRTLRRSPQLRSPRGMFCLMGSCQECLVMVDGRRTLACQTAVVAGLRVERLTQFGSND